ncbi:MAG: cytidine deaminase [Bacteroidota bacterium]
MPKRRIEINFTESNSFEELGKKDLRLLEIAFDAGKSAYAPYSHYYVGACVLLTDGTIVKGNNQENMAFPSGLCAERVAVFSASANHPGVAIEAIAITAESNEFPVSEPVTPCGACRQALIEYEYKQNSPIRMIMGCKSGKSLIFESVADLLPLSFKEEKLKR